MLFVWAHEGVTAPSPLPREHDRIAAAALLPRFFPGGRFASRGMSNFATSVAGTNGPDITVGAYGTSVLVAGVDVVGGNDEAEDDLAIATWPIPAAASALWPQGRAYLFWLVDGHGIDFGMWENGRCTRALAGACGEGITESLGRPLPPEEPFLTGARPHRCTEDSPLSFDATEFGSAMMTHAFGVADVGELSELPVEGFYGDWSKATRVGKEQPAQRALSPKQGLISRMFRRAD